MATSDPFLPELDPTTAEAAEVAATARALVTAYLAHADDPVILRVVLRSTLAELYDGLRPSMGHTRRAAELLCSLIALLQVALSGVGQLAV